MKKIDIGAAGRMVAVTVAAVADGGSAGKSARFTVDARFGDVRERIADSLRKATGTDVLFLTGRRGRHELPVGLPVPVGKVANFLSADAMFETVPLYNALLDGGWTPVFKSPSGRGAWTLEVEASEAADAPQEVGGVVHVDGQEGKPAFRGEF